MKYGDLWAKGMAVFRNANKLGQGLLIAWIACIAIQTGCNNNRYLGGPPMGASWQLNPAIPVGQQPFQYPTQTLPPQIAELQKRVQQLDDNNRQLTTQLAQSQQQLQVFRERGDLMQRQLQETTAQLQQSRVAQQTLQSQTSGLQNAMAQRGGAKLTANNSVLASVANVQIPGAQVQTDGDVIRIRVPADQLFSPGTAQLNPGSVNILDQIGAILVREFPRRRVGIEGHSDAGPMYGGSFSSPYQLSGAQAQAVLDSLMRRNGVPTGQLFVAAHGINHARADNQTPAGRAENRRIEVVVYPDSF